MSTILSVPGLYGSELQHWQTWLERKLPNTQRVEQEDWDNPILPIWAQAVSQSIQQARGKVWIIAHSFGCLASIYAAQKTPEKIAGAMFVAPANPSRFSLHGFQAGKLYVSARENVALHLPKQALSFPSVMVASSNDPWMPLETAEAWADTWESRFINIGAAGHINVASGFGAWPQGLNIFEEFQRSIDDLPQGAINTPQQRFNLVSQEF